jgi:hypothetical protein
LQVSERNKKYKNFLHEILRWFDNTNNYTVEEYEKKIDTLIWNKFKKNSEYKNYLNGTNTPHFLFNFIDYLYWIDRNPKINFEFRYRNSVEHHLPQSFEGNNKDWLGNLCLVSKSANSRMNNESPLGKADETGKYYNEDLPPKRKIMYDITNRKKNWTDTEIQDHHDEVVTLLNKSKHLLGILNDDK